MNRDEMYLSLGVSDKVLQFGEAVLDELKPRFAGIEEIAELNQAKVIGAMQKNRVNATHLRERFPHRGRARPPADHLRHTRAGHRAVRQPAAGRRDARHLRQALRYA